MEVAWIGSEPFIGRPVLKRFVRDLQDPRSTDQILAIDGSPGSGKSTSRRFVSHVAETTRTFDFTSLHLSHSSTASVLVEQVYKRFGWDAEAELLQGQRPAAARGITRNLARRAESHPRRVVLLFKVERLLASQVSEDAVDLCVRLASDPLHPPLIFIGFDETRFPGGVRGRIRREHLAALTLPEVAAIVRLRLERLGFSEQSVAGVVAFGIQELGPLEEQRVAEYIGRLLLVAGRALSRP